MHTLTWNTSALLHFCRTPFLVGANINDTDTAAAHTQQQQQQQQGEEGQADGKAKGEDLPTTGSSQSPSLDAVMQRIAEDADMTEERKEVQPCSCCSACRGE